MFNDYKIVGIGCCCEISFVISRLELSKISYPFDWCLVKNIRNVANVISNDFQDFYNLNVQVEDLYVEQKMLSIGNSEIYIPHYNDNTYNERLKQVENLKNLLNSDNKILFMWKSHVYRNPSIEDVDYFCNKIKEKYPNLEFKLFIVNEYDENQNINLDYNEYVDLYNIVSDNISCSINDRYINRCDIEDHVLQKWKHEILKNEK